MLPLTFTANAAASTPIRHGTITGYTWQLFKSPGSHRRLQRAFAAHGWTLDTGFQGAPVIGTGGRASPIPLTMPGTYWLRVIVEDDEGQPPRRHSGDPRPVLLSRSASLHFFFPHHESNWSAHPLRCLRHHHPEHQATHQHLRMELWRRSTTATGETVSHAFASAGHYDVQLTVTFPSGGQTHSLTT